MSDGPKCEISEAEVKIAVDNQLKNQEFKIIDFKIGNANEAVLGFLGDHTRIVANVLVNGEQKQLKYFAKKQVTGNPSHRYYCEGVRVFYKEIELYKTVFADMQDAIAPERRQDMKWRPDCYYTRDHDLLVVEDLSPLGFYMLPERTLMDMDHLKATLRVVAKMHASSIIFEEKLNVGKSKTRSPLYSADKGRQLIGDLYPNVIFDSEVSDIREDHPGHRFMEAGIISQKAVINLLPGYTPEQKAQIDEKFRQVARTIYRMVEPSKKFRNVFCHADLWGNNIMFVDKPSGEVDRAITVDFQCSRYVPPAMDLYMLLHLMQDTAFRAKHENELKDFYYEQLKKELAVENIDVKNIISEEEWNESCVFYKKFAILGQFIYTQLNYAPAEMTDKVFSTAEGHSRLMYNDRSQFITDSIQADEICRSRSFEAMEEIIKAFDLV